MNVLHAHKARFCYFLGVLLDFIFLQNPCFFVCLFVFVVVVFLSSPFISIEGYLLLLVFSRG